MPWRLLEYGRTLSELLAELDLKAEARVKRDLLRLAQEGNKLRAPQTDSLGNGLFELRTPHNRMTYRSIFMFNGDQIIILVSFVKKTQKTPSSLIELAKARQAEILRGEVGVGKVTVH